MWEKWEVKKYKNNLHQVRLIEKLQKAIMIVRMCRPLVLAASKHRKSCGGLCLHCADLSVPSGAGWVPHALSSADIHTHIRMEASSLTWTVFMSLEKFMTFVHISGFQDSTLILLPRWFYLSIIIQCKNVSSWNLFTFSLYFFCLVSDIFFKVPLGLATEFSISCVFSFCCTYLFYQFSPSTLLVRGKHFMLFLKLTLCMIC